MMRKQADDKDATQGETQSGTRNEAQSGISGDAPGNAQRDAETAPAAAPVAALGMRPAVRILIIAQHAGAEDAAVLAAAGLDAMPRLRNLLEAAEHTVSVASPAQWQQAATGVQPTMVLLEASTQAAAGREEVVEICRALKKESSGRPVLAVLPAGDESVLSGHWRALQAAGADDFITSGISRSELEARILLLARYAAALRENEAAQERLARHMQIDETTQLLNRRFFFQSGHRETSRARRYGHTLSCLMVDIDYLDEVGKTFGYACVEYVLRAVAYTVRQWTRDSDIGGRFSERKFAVLLPETDVEGAVAVREKILNAIAESQFVWEGKELPVSVSIGEAERRYERAFGNGSTAAEESESVEGALDEFGTEPLSVREELAALLEDADAALNVARRASLRPNIFVQYTPGG